MNDAKLLTDPAERAEAWAAIDEKITELAPAVNWLWDKTPLIKSANVNAVPSAFNGQWHLAYTSIN
jgi:hypothetical protein